MLPQLHRFITPTRKTTSLVQFRRCTTTAARSGQSDKTLQELHDELRMLQERTTAVKNAIRYYKDDKKKRILVLGAGRSATTAIDYFLEHAPAENWLVRVGDANLALAESKVKGNPHGVPFKYDVNDRATRMKEIKDADIVVSLLPPALHDLLIEDCLAFKKSLMTASYTTEKMKSSDQQAKDAGVLFLNEMGLDPGIDHMACMSAIDKIKANDGSLTGVETFTGGLVAPQSDNNPWNYKFTWNPKNVVLAGQGGCKFIINGALKYIPYHKVFSRNEPIFVHGAGNFEGYANRDSLKYRSLYSLEHVPTFFRGTLRRPGFCSAWDIFVQLGLTDDSYSMEDSEHLTYRQFINSALMHTANDSVELKLCYHLGLSVDSPEMRKLKWLGIFENRPIGLKNATPAEILLSLLGEKWKMKHDDQDMIVMYNKFNYDDIHGNPQEYITSLVYHGKDRETTAMASTVGLPLAIATRGVLRGDINLTGVHIPTSKEIYEPVLKELESYDVKFDHFLNAVPTTLE